MTHFPTCAANFAVSIGYWPDYQVKRCGSILAGHSDILFFFFGFCSHGMNDSLGV
jgi:hypothetical protein